MSGKALPRFTDEQHAALRTAEAILGAYDRGILDISARYLADTLKVLLAALQREDDEPSATHRHSSLWVLDADGFLTCACGTRWRPESGGRRPAHQGHVCGPFCRAGTHIER